jgi:tetratricopeptide (TPR) repeat protein
VKWFAPIAEERFSLASALATLDQAAALLDDEDPAALRAQVEALRAHVLYDVGDAEALHDALAALRIASRTLLEAGEPLESARFLNDEAAIWARMGDHQRASGLLQRSREVFAELAEQSPTARIELAETDHLVARLALHAGEGVRRDRAALEFAMECAAAAEKAFRELGMPHDSARARETLGRLELMQQAHDEARGHIRSALTDQQHLGDAMGLARTTAAYAELLIASGQLDEALERLEESLELNLWKGSLRGVRHNKASLNLLAERAAEDERRDLGPEIDRLAARIAESEARLGRGRHAHGGDRADGQERDGGRSARIQ